MRAQSTGMRRLLAAACATIMLSAGQSGSVETVARETLGPNDGWAALGSGTIANVGDVLLQANGTVNSISDAGASSATPGSAAVGAAVDLGFINNTVRADIGPAVNVSPIS